MGVLSVVEAPQSYTTKEFERPLEMQVWETSTTCSFHQHISVGLIIVVLKMLRAAQ